MGIFFQTGRHLSWLACLLLVCVGPDTRSASADELSNSVASELIDLSRAFRSLDQSFQYRGMSSRLASTAGSVFVDWEAKGIPEEHGPEVKTPAPVIVGCAAQRPNAHQCDQCCGTPQPVAESCCACQQSGCGALRNAGPHDFRLHGHSQNGCAATIGVPLHPEHNDCRSTIGIPLHPVASFQEAPLQGGCLNCNPCNDYAPTQGLIAPSCDCASTRCESCYVVEQYRNGVLTRTTVACENCRSLPSSQR